MKQDNILGIVFSNMHDDTVHELTSHRSMGSIPVGGRYRMIDFPLSSLVNAGVADVGVITKSNYQSLMDHLGNGREWDLSRKLGGLSILPPFSQSGSGMYRGKVEALAGISGYIEKVAPQSILMVDCDTIANLDLRGFISAHNASGAELSVMYTKAPVCKEQLATTSVFEVNDAGFVTDMQVKTQESGVQNVYMNICMASRQFLERAVFECASHNRFNLDVDVLQASVGKMPIYAHQFDGYSARIGSLKSYYDASMAMLHKEVRQQLFPLNRPVYTKVRDEAPVLYGLHANVRNSLVADGCRIDGEVENSIIFRGVRIGKGAKVRNSVVMQGCVLGDYTSLDSCILDKNVVIQEGRSLMGFETYPIFIAKGSVV